MSLGKYIQTRRKELGLSRNRLATEAGISHTEINRIETGERRNPSIALLLSLSEALNVSIQDLLVTAGCLPDTGISETERVFPKLKTPHQRETIEQIADLIACSALDNNDLDMIFRQVDMCVYYITNKKKSCKR